VRSEELTEPGFIPRHVFGDPHHLQAVAAYAELGDELAERGLHYAETPNETAATVLPNGRVTIAYRDVERTVAAFEQRDAAPT